jgi:hypothetical protein
LTLTIPGYTLPVAAATVLGGVKQGSNVTIAGDGTLSVAAPYTLTSGGIATALGYTPQASGSYITALTGDVTASGPGSAITTLKSTGTAGTYAYPSSVTTDAQGRVSGIVAGSAPTGGTVTSVGLSLPGLLFNATVPGSPVTTSGTLAPTLATQTAGTVLAGPATGAAAAPTFTGSPTLSGTLTAAGYSTSQVSGTDVAAAALNITGGQATGAGRPGVIYFLGDPAGLRASGSAIATARTLWTMDAYDSSLNGVGGGNIYLNTGNTVYSNRGRLFFWDGSNYGCRNEFAFGSAYYGISNGSGSGRYVYFQAAGNNTAAYDSGGHWSFGASSNGTSSQVEVDPASASTAGVVVKLASGQTANARQTLSSTGTALEWADNVGNNHTPAVLTSVRTVTASTTAAATDTTIITNGSPVAFAAFTGLAGHSWTIINTGGSSLTCTLTGGSITQGSLTIASGHNATFLTDGTNLYQTAGI